MCEPLLGIRQLLLLNLAEVFSLKLSTAPSLFQVGTFSYSFFFFFLEQRVPLENMHVFLKRLVRHLNIQHVALV